MTEPRNQSKKAKADSVGGLEGNILSADKARQIRLPRGRRARHAIQWLRGNPGGPTDSFEREYDEQPITRENVKRSVGIRMVA